MDDPSEITAVTLTPKLEVLPTHLVALVRAGTRFERGLLVERDEDAAA